MLVCCSSITVHQQHCSSLSSSFPSTTSSIIYQSARSFLACSPTCLLPPDIYNWFSIANNNHAHTAAYDSSTPPLLFPIIIICCPQKPNISRAVFPFPHSHIPGGTPQSPASPSLVDRTGASSACPTATKQFDGSTRRTNTPVPHLQHYLPSSIYILEDSLVDFRHQDKKAAGSCFGHQ